MNLKSLTKLLLVASLLSSLFSNGQTKSGIIKDIRKKFILIENLLEKGTLAKKEIAYNCDPGIDGSLSFYYQDTQLQLISHSFDQGHSSRVDSYYIYNDKLIFFFRQDHADNDIPIYDAEGLVDIEEDWSTSELRIYFDKEKAVKCLVKQYNNKDVTKEIEEKYDVLSAYFKNKRVDCDSVGIQEILYSYFQLANFQEIDAENICKLH